MTLTSNAQSIKLGDVNHDGNLSVADVTALVDIILNGYLPFSVSPEEVTMLIGETTDVTISGGYDFYEVEAANPNIVTAALNGSTVTLTAVSAGETTVTVKDVLTFRTIDIPVVNYVALHVSSNELSLIADERGKVEITSGGGSYDVQISDANVATLVLDGNYVFVTAVGVGTATITVTDTKSGQTEAIEVKVTSLCPDNNHPHLIDLGLPSGTKWACCNVGADKPEVYGGCYAWGETKEHIDLKYNWSTYTHCGGSADTCRDLDSDLDIAGTEYDVAHVEWGGTWVMPSKEQQDELRDNCTYKFTTVNGISGGKITSNSNGGSIFLPAAGFRWINTSSRPDYVGNAGYYWSSTQVSSGSHTAYDLFINPNGAYEGNGSRSCGYSVRPVSR